jgi:hypothetical protein
METIRASNEQSTRLSKRQAFKSSATSPFLDSNRLTFRAFGRSFVIYLKRETSLVADHFDIELRYSSKSGLSSKHIGDFFTRNYYIGYVDGESNSRVLCYFEPKSNTSIWSSSIIETESEQKNSLNDKSSPLIYAQIIIDNEQEKTVYYIEPKTTSDSNTEYIVYRSEDIQSLIYSDGIFKLLYLKKLFVIYYI